MLSFKSYLPPFISGRLNFATLTNLLDDIEEEWKQHLPDFEYIYNDLGTLNDAEVKTLNNKFLAVSCLALKDSFEKEWIEGNAAKLLMQAARGPKNCKKGLSFICTAGAG